MTKPIVLAYSGGLDTSVGIGWIKEATGQEVIALAVDVGQGGEDMEEIRQRAIDCGAVDSIVVDAKDEFAENYLVPALRANALYQKRYPLVSALSRPLIAKHLVLAARESGADTVAHGCTGKGNDQVRFEVAVSSLDPALKRIAPIRDLALTRDKAISYAESKGLPIKQSKQNSYSVDKNVWGRTVETGPLEDPWAAPLDDVWEYTKNPSADNLPEELTIQFTQGSPVALDDISLSPLGLIETLSKRAGDHGIGRVDLIEDRLVGIKSREVYEVPAAQTLITAHEELENLVLERDTGRYKRKIEADWANLVYDGLWFSDLRKALDSFIESTQENVTGEIRCSLHAGVVSVTGRKSEKSLYDLGLATYDTGDTFDQSHAAGFIELWGLPGKISATRRGRS